MPDTELQSSVHDLRAPRSVTLREPHLARDRDVLAKPAGVNCSPATSLPTVSRPDITAPHP
jgi:hypothetical protein